MTLLKGNYQLEPIADSTEEEPAENRDQKFRKRALASIGGSMVFVERKTMVWDVDDDDTPDDQPEQEVDAD